MSKNSIQRNRLVHQHRLRRKRQENLLAPYESEASVTPNASVECGWGRLVFAHTFESPEMLAEILRAEGTEQRDIAFYVRDPHVALAAAPQELFLDPSHTYRLDLATYRLSKRRSRSFSVRRLTTRNDADAVNVMYASRGMVTVLPEFFWSQRDGRILTMLVAEDAETSQIIGTVMGIDHARAFNDPEAGSSLWCLAVAPQAPHAGVGEALVRCLAEHFKTKGANYMDLSVLHDNVQAITLYEKLGFKRVPMFAIKRKNVINETLYTVAFEEKALNPYAMIIIDEARKRGIATEIVDAEGGFFRLTYGGRSIACRESLSEFTSAIAISICDDKRVTRRIVKSAGVKVPAQITTDDPEVRADFLSKYGCVVVKPARGEQGRGISVRLTNTTEMEAAVRRAKDVCPNAVVEEYFDGEDLRLIVIDYKVVAAAVRRPARVVGDGVKTVIQLIEAQSRRRSAATEGESSIPLDGETERCVAAAGYRFDDVLPCGIEIAVRKTANLHTGGTIHDVTAETHPALIEAATLAARAIEIPVTGIDLMVRSPRKPEYVFIEANERPGLANHEPQPTAERFVDFLFPLSVPQFVRDQQRKAS